MTAGLYPRSDWGHLVVALPPALVQILLIAGVRDAAAAPARRLLAGGLVLGAMVNLQKASSNSS